MIRHHEGKEIVANHKLNLKARAKAAARLKAQKAKAAQRLRAQKERLRARKAQDLARAKAAREREKLRRKKAKEAARAKLFSFPGSLGAREILRLACSQALFLRPQ